MLSQITNVIPLGNRENVVFTGGLTARMSIRNRVVYIEADTVNSNPSGFFHIVYPTTSSKSQNTPNYSAYITIGTYNSIQVEPGVYKFAVSAKTNVLAQVRYAVGNVGDSVQNGFSLNDGESNVVTVTVTRELFFCVALAFITSSYPYKLKSEIKLSLIKIR